MGGDPHSSTPELHRGGTTTVFTDGACSGNPGPGGWAWVEVDGAWASGFEPATTNQRMEVTAALEACERFEGPLRIVSDSTYVVNCWRDRWWQGWLKRGWKNSQKKPVANQDLWERLVPHFRDRTNLELEWVKGHSGDRWNDVADRLAVAAVEHRDGATGDQSPTEDELGAADRPARRRTSAAPSAPGSESPSDPGGSRVGGQDRSARRRAADPRVPAGHLLMVAGLRRSSLAANAEAVDALAQVIAAHAEMHPDLVVLSGLRSGAEELGASVATTAGAPVAVILPYPDPTAGWPERERAGFETAVAAAREVVVLEKTRPGDLDGRRKALARRDGWLRGVADLAVVITDGHDPEAEAALRRWEKALGDDVWRLDAPG